MEPDTLVKTKADYRALREKALSITDRASAENRALTSAEQAEIERTVEQAKALHDDIEHAALDRYPDADTLITTINEAVKDREREAGGGPKTRDAHPWTKALTEARHLVGGHGEKAGVTGGGQGTVVVGSLADPAARLGAPGGELLALVTVEDWASRGDGSSVEFLREATRALHAASGGHLGGQAVERHRPGNGHRCGVARMRTTIGGGADPVAAPIRRTSTRLIRRGLGLRRDSSPSRTGW